MTVFYTWPFPVSIGSYAGPDTRTSRTLPVRLSEVVNVKDWGAIGDASHNDGPDIQAAIDFCIAQGGGRVFFPPGQYLCSSTNLVIGSDTDDTAFIQLIGSGGAASGGASKIIGPATGWTISKGTKNYDLIQRMEGIGVNGYGCVKITGDGVGIYNCSFSGLVCVDAAQATGCTIADCGGGGADDPSSNAGTPPIFSTTGVGYYLGNSCLLTNCRTMGSNWITYALSGTGASLIGASTETTYTAVRVGWAPDADPAVIGGGRELEALGCVVSGMQTEKQMVTMELYNARACWISANAITGGHGTPTDQAITNLSWSGGTATATTTAAHNLPVGNSLLQLNINDLVPPTAWRPTQFTTCTRTGATTFTYPIAVDPGAAPSYSGTGWTWPPLYGLRCRAVSECVIVANSNQLNASLAAVDMQYDSVAECIHAHNVFIGMNGGQGWLPPLGPNAAGWKFINCGVQALAGAGTTNPLASPSPCGTMTFADLPGQFTDTDEVYQGGPFETQEFDISDGAKSGGGAAVWDDTVQGGSSGKYKVRWNGSVWKRIG